MNFIHDIIHFNSIHKPKHIAIIDGERFITYKELWEKVQKLCGWFIKNFDTQTRIGIMLNNSIEAVCCMYAASAAGMICVPIDADMHSRNLIYIINDCQVKLIVTSEKFINRFDNIDIHHSLKFILINGHATDNNSIFNLEEILLNAEKPEYSLPKLSPKNTTCILYTTGTMGPQKGVMLNHFNLLSATKNINQFMQIGPWAVESLPMRLSHSFGFARLRSVFDVGGTIILENGFIRPEWVLYNMKMKKANAISSVPAGFSILLEYFPEQLKETAPQIKYIEIGSAFMRQSHKEKLMEYCSNARICMHYGLTEASRASFLEFHEEKYFLHTVGKPSPNVKMKIVNEKGEDVGINALGEILVKGGMIMQGYWRKPELTKETLGTGWLHTEDLGLIDEKGYVHLMGRKKEIINIGGLKVAPGEVEEVLLKYHGILETAVIGYKSPEEINEEIIKAFIVVNDENKFRNLDDLKKYCLREMEAYKIPKEFEIVKSLPKTSSGKIQRHLLLKREDNPYG